MSRFLYRFFIERGPRKLLALILAVVLWLLVNHSLTSSKTIHNIPVRIVNVPLGKTISDLQTNGLLNKRVALTLFGNKKTLEELSTNDLEVVIDAQNRQGEWIASINKKNLISTHPAFDIHKEITRVAPASVIIRLTKLVSEKIPVFITHPMGQAPADYQFVDVWPYQLHVGVTGPEEVIKRLKAKGVRLTFDLNEIAKAQLDGLQPKQNGNKGSELSFFIPDTWKKVSIPALSETPIELDDPRAKDLRIDFVRVSLLRIKKPLPITLYFPPGQLATFNPETIRLADSDLVKQMSGSYIYNEPLYAKGVSQLFLEIVEDMMQMTVIVQPNHEKNELHWSVQFINPRQLEDRFVSMMLSDASNEEMKELQPNLREEYLRNRFRSYMSSFQLFKSDDKRLELQVVLEEQTKVVIKESCLFPHHNGCSVNK